MSLDLGTGTGLVPNVRPRKCRFACRADLCAPRGDGDPAACFVSRPTGRFPWRECLLSDRTERSSSGVVQAGGDPPSDADLLNSKFAPSSLHARDAERPRLLERVPRRRSKRLTVVDAPAGYGKTTLLADWYRQRHARRRRRSSPGCRWSRPRTIRRSSGATSSARCGGRGSPAAPGPSRCCGSRGRTLRRRSARCSTISRHSIAGRHHPRRLPAGPGARLPRAVRVSARSRARRAYA